MAPANRSKEAKGARKNPADAPIDAPGTSAMHPTAAAAQVAAGAASSAAMAGVMLALKALQATDADSNKSVRRLSDEFENRADQGGSSKRETAGSLETGRPTEEGKGVAGVSDRGGLDKGVPDRGNLGRAVEKEEGEHIGTGKRQHRKKRNGAGQGVRLDVPSDGLSGPMSALQGGAPGSIQSSSKALAHLPKGGSKRGGIGQMKGEGKGSQSEKLGFGGEVEGKGGSQKGKSRENKIVRVSEAASKAAEPDAGFGLFQERDQGLQADANKPSILPLPLEETSVAARPGSAENPLPQDNDTKPGASEPLQSEQASPTGVQIEDPPGVRDGYLGSSGSALESLGEQSASGSSLGEGGWTPGKSHADEDDSSESWRKHKRHFFILSNAGKPIYSRYGDEHKLAGFSATLQAIMSYVESSGDSLHSIRAGAHKFVFMARGPIYLVAISATGEPELSLRKKLDLLYGQLISILTDSIERTFHRNQKFNVHPLLGGTEPVFSSLVHAFSRDYAVLLQAFTCLPLPYAARQAAGVALQEIASPGLVFGLLLAPGGKMISLVSPKRNPPHPDDILLLCNFVGSSDSFRTSESFVPLCLPKHNPGAFLYAYVGYLEPEVCLVLLTSQQDGFFHLKECRAHIEQSLRITGVFREVAASVTRDGLRVEEVPTASTSAQRRLASGAESGVNIGSLPTSRSSITASNHTLRQKQTASGDASTSGRWGFGRPRDAGLPEGLGGPAGLWHFLYRNAHVDQYVASEYSPPLNTRSAQKRVFQAYQRLLASMQGDGAKAGPHRMQYRRDGEFVTLAWSTTDFDFYAVFDPLADKDAAIAVCNRVCSSIREIEGDLFQTGPVPLAW